MNYGQTDLSSYNDYFKLLPKTTQMQKLIDLVFRSQKHKQGGASHVQISTFRAVPVPVTPEEKRAAKRRREEEDYERRVKQMAEDIPDIQIDHERTKNDPDYVYYQATDTADSDSDIGDNTSDKRRYNTIDIVTVALIANKYNVSHRAAAAIASAVLIDYSVISLDEAHLLVTETKVRARREKLLAASSAARTEHVSTPGEVSMVVWDAKETTPQTQKEISGRKYRVCGGKADTYVMTYEPQGQYLCEFTVRGEATKECPYAKLAAIQIYQSVINLGIDWDQVEVCGHDTENTNTGQWKGIIVFLEFLIGRKLERSPCCLHLNELHYRAVFTALDGKSSSGGTWTGPAGKLIPKLKKKQLEFNDDFEAIPGTEDGALVELPEDVLNDLSSDQKLLYKLVKMVKSGVKIPNIELYEIGGISLARWLTHSIAIILIYCSKHGLEDEATRKLKLIVTHITNCYAPMWFKFKTYPLLTDAPRHWFCLLRLCADSEPEVRDIAIKSVTRNSYYFHSESILLSYVTSKTREDRVFAVEMIKKIRARSDNPNLGCKKERTRMNPKQLNTSASKLHEVISESEYKYEPLHTCDIPTNELDNLVESPLVIKPYPSNTQSVERAIREMTEAGQRVSTEGRRDGVIVARQIANFVLPQNTSKSDMEKLFSAKSVTYSDSVRSTKKHHSI